MEKDDLSEGAEEVDAVTTIATTTKKPETTSQHKQVTKHTRRPADESNREGGETNYRGRGS